MFWPDDPVKWLSPRGLLGARVTDEDGRVLGQIDLRTAETDATAGGWSRAADLPPNRRLDRSLLRFAREPRSRRRRRLFDAACAAAATVGRRPVLDVVDNCSNPVRFYERRGWRRAFSEPWPLAPEALIHYYIAPESSARSRGERTRAS